MRSHVPLRVCPYYVPLRKSVPRPIPGLRCRHTRPEAASWGKVRRPEMTEQRDVVVPLLPAPSHLACPPRNAREMLDAMLWILRTEAPWRDCPDWYGPWITAYVRFRRRRNDGVLDRIVERLQVMLDDARRNEAMPCCGSVADEPLPHAHRARGTDRRPARSRTDVIRAPPLRAPPEPTRPRPSPEQCRFRRERDGNYALDLGPVCGENPRAAPRGGAVRA